ncbi:restriction endonuclease subunit S, partial [Chryseobacterium sp. NRRL B-14859]|uniref:restriction endonuclease subunit S n=1 Tax=Chryseobacterium sp. NRRL B-14859 TaxID=1562763 RepID=UPI0033984EAA
FPNSGDLVIPKLRFPEFDKGWEYKKLGEIGELTSSKRIYLSEYVDDGVPFYRGKEISELKQKIQPKDILYISSQLYNDYKNKYGVPKINDILITAVGTLGNILVIKDEEPFYFKDGNLIWFKNIILDSDFVAYLLEINKKSIELSAIGSSQKALTMVELKKLSFQFPSISEQNKIASFLLLVDERIQTQKKII